MRDLILERADFRPDIQGLRAIAVLAVLLFHVWPNLVPGGYVGVDVFFLISGYLITGLLFKELSSKQNVSLPKFYARRIRRLLPAATVVMLAVAFFAALLPASKLNDTSAELASSALYMQNWWLAFQAVDYLAAENSPGPLQHFWSLSVEEQYYVFWPLCLYFAAKLGCKLGLSLKQSLIWLSTAVIACSLAYSVWLTHAEPGLAYFATTTRAWQLALGGILAISNPWSTISARIRNALVLAGGVAIAVAASIFTTATPFPGYAALLPTVGAALILFAGKDSSPVSFYRLLSSRPARYFGDISYSLYLWHWPVIIFMQQYVGQAFGLLDGLIAILISCALAHQTKDLIEDRFRHPSESSRERWLPFAMAAALIVMVLAAALALRYGWIIPGAPTKNAANIAHNRIESTDVRRPIGIRLEAPESDFAPKPDKARGDDSDSYSGRCFSSQDESVPRACTYGESGGRSVVLVGDSHAAQWLPTLQRIAEDEKWHITTYLNADCGFGYAELVGRKKDSESRCVAWSRAVVEEIVKSPHEFVFVTQSTRHKAANVEKGAQNVAALANGISAALSELGHQQQKLVIIRDTPRMEQDVPACLMKSSAIEQCGTSRRAALSSNDPLVVAAEKQTGMILLDMTNAICTETSCPAVVGRFLVWRDSHRLTATYARHIASYFASALQSPSVSSEGVDFSVVKPSLQDVKDDNPFVYKQGCHVDQRSDKPIPCSFGATSEPVKAFIVGDSHAAQWIPALEVIARENSWHFVSHTKSACAFVQRLVVIGKNPVPYQSCVEWVRNVTSEISRVKPDYLIISQSIAREIYGSKDSEENVHQMTDALVSQWQLLQSMGIELVAIRDTPRMGFDVPDCLNGGMESIDQCSRSSLELLNKPDPLVHAAKAFSDVHLLDLTEQICPEGTCSPIINNMIVWRDAHHLTATYAGFLAGPMRERLVPILERN